MSSPSEVSSDEAVSLSGQQAGFRYILITLTIVFCWVVGWYWQTALEMLEIWWRSDTFAHGLVVWPIFAWLVWRQKSVLNRFRPLPSWRLSLLLIPTGLLWTIGVIAHVSAAMHFALIAMFVAGCMAALGWSVSRVILFPLLFLFFAVPVGEFLLPVLMSATAEFTVGALRLSGIPVYQEGLHFIVPNGRWSVVEACSGIRYLFASLMIGSLYAYLYYTRFYRRAAFMLVALCVPIVANWLRAYLIVMIGYFSDNRLATGVDHLVYGWLFFGVVVMLMFWIGGRWQESPAATPERPDPVSHNVAPQKWVWGLQALIVMLFPVVVSMGSVAHVLQTEQNVVLESPVPAQGWSYGISGAVAFQPHYQGYRALLETVYLDQYGVPVSLFVAVYADQRDSSEMVTWGNGLLPPESLHARITGAGVVDTAIGEVRRARIATDTRYFEVRHWYSINGEIVTSDIEARLLLALNRLLGKKDASAVVVVSTPVDDDVADANRRLDTFLSGHAQAIHQLIDTAMAAVSGT